MGNSAGTLVSSKMGIGTTTPWARLSVAGAAGGNVPLFTISTSTASATSTALIVDQNGNVGIGTSSPTTALQINGGITPNADNVFNDGNATYRWAAVYAANGTIQTSDERLKGNITTTTYGLDQIMQLRPVSYMWKAQPEQRTHLGFIAQEVQPILPETVNIGDDANHTLGLTYTEFIPVIVNAIKEVASVTGAFREAFIAWLGGATHGIGKLFADQGRFQTLCVGSTCITEPQLKDLLARENIAASANAPAGDTGPGANTADTEPPAITINGNNPAELNVGDTYNDLGATVTDNVDKNLGIQTYIGSTPIEFATIETKEPATYHIYYVATDGAGNTATSTRTVIIEAVLPMAEASSTQGSSTAP
jgi:hypothetical protein